MNGNSTAHSNGAITRAQEIDSILTAVQRLLSTFIDRADNDDEPGALIQHYPPKQLSQLLQVAMPHQGLGRQGFLEMVEKLFQYSANTWHNGFLDKLYASVTPVGLASELLLSSLNTNVHVYQVSPVLTIIEKQTSKALAQMFGFTGQFAGGISQPGGSAANSSSMVIARNVLFPETKTEGNNKKFVLFTSAHGHYSIEKAAQMLGFGSNAVITVAVDDAGRMRVDALEKAVSAALEQGQTPFYVNATAGTTVLGSYDPFESIAAVCKKHKLWMHIDGSWGSPVIFSDRQKHKMVGSSLADSLTICPHKMLNVPITCSFLLGKDMRQFHQGMTLPAGYLFHNDDANSSGEIWDLADLTPQCGRRGDSLKMAMTWIYYGTEGLRDYVDHAFDMAADLAQQVQAHPRFTLLSSNPPPCLQICFYYDKQSSADLNSQTTKRIAHALIKRNFMIDFAPGEDGHFFRVVVNGQTKPETVVRLVQTIDGIGGSSR